MTFPLSPAQRSALYARIIARSAEAPPAPLSEDDEDYLRDRAYDASKVSGDEVREERETWAR